MTKDELVLSLINARKKKKLSQRETTLLINKALVQDGISIKRQYYSMIEKNERRPSVEVAKAIAFVLDLDWTIFFEIKGNQELPKSKSTA